MRQAGIIAAGALFALRNHRARLADDHANAKLLAAGLDHLEGLDVVPAEVETNMVRFRVKRMSAEQLVEQLRARGVLVLSGWARYHPGGDQFNGVGRRHRGGSKDRFEFAELSEPDERANNKCKR